MKILAIDSSGLVASVAVTENNILIAEYSIQYKITHSQTLLPMLEDIRKRIELDLASIDAIAVASGPGSFTGLRIGSATAKGLAMALDIPIIAVPTLEGMAYSLYGTDKLVCPLMDARRGQVYTGIYEFRKYNTAYGLCSVLKQTAVSIEEAVSKLNELGREVILTGDGVPVFEDNLRESLRVEFSFAPAHCNRQSASAIAALAQEYYNRGEIQSAQEHQPEYLRMSQAERERQARL